MVKVRPFHYSDAYAMGQAQEGQRADDEGIIRAGIRQYAMRGPAWTVTRDDGYVLAMGGLAIQWKGYAVAWAFVLDHATRMERMEAARLALKLFKGVGNSLGLRRIEATTRTDFEEAATFIRRLGFECEGVRAKFGPDGADHWMWAKVA